MLLMQNISELALDYWNYTVKRERSHGNSLRADGLKCVLEVL